MKHLECHTCGCRGHDCCCQSRLQFIPKLHQDGCRNDIPVVLPDLIDPPSTWELLNRRAGR